MNNHYLDILGLKPGATQKEVKLAYRRLSKIYHPDINSSPDAKEKFIAITEAYNFLSKVGPRPHLENVSYDYDPTIAEYEKWRRQAQEKARKRAKEEAKMQQALMAKFLKGINYGMVIALVFNILLVFDYFLPRKISHEKVYTIHKSIIGGKYEADVVYFENFTIEVEKEIVEQYISNDGFIDIQLTKLFEMPMGLMVENVFGKYKLYHNMDNVYIILQFAIPLFFIVLLLYTFTTSTLDSKLTLGIFMFFIICCEYFMLIMPG